MAKPFKKTKSTDRNTKAKENIDIASGSTPVIPPSGTDKKSSPDKDPKKNKPSWVAIVALCISIIGGVPGIITAIKWANDKPKFEFLAPPITDLEFEAGGPNSIHRYTAFFVTGAIYNSGEQPLYPADYKLSVKFSNEDSLKNYPARDLGVVTDMLFKNNDQFKFFDSTKFISVWKMPVLKPKETQWVYMFFLTESPERSNVNMVKSSLWCMDLKGVERSAEIIITKRTGKGEMYYNPINGQMYKEPK